MYYDSKSGYIDNAIVGAILAVNPGATDTNSKIETQPPKFAPNGKYLVFQPFPDLWADSYSVWNLAFVGGEYGDWPLYFSKLLTPCVSCYRDLKGSYIFQRAVNLALHIISSTISHNQRKSEDPEFDLRAPNWTKTFGASNRKNSEAYFAQIIKNDPAKAVERQQNLDDAKKVVDALKNGGGISATYNLMKLGLGKCEESLLDKIKSWLDWSKKKRMLK